VWPDFIVLLFLAFNLPLSFLECLKPVDVETLLSEAGIEALYDHILKRLAWPDKVQLHSVVIYQILNAALLLGSIKALLSGQGNYSAFSSFDNVR
jgi:hypothetical protein